MEVTYCKKCHQKKHLKNYDIANKEIENIMGVKVSDRCMSVCGLAKVKHIVEVDYEYIECETYDSLINTLKERYDRS
jgi:Fe-S oxidoreductase